MRTEKQLQKIHDEMQVMLLDTINSGLKFEVCVSMAKQIIRVDYHTVDMEEFRSRLPRNTDEGIIKLMVDPSSTPKNVYKTILDNIYAVNRLTNTILKNSPNLKKEKKLLLLVEINYLSHYLDKSQIQIGEYLSEHPMFGIVALDPFSFSKEAYRYIEKANAIRNTSDKIYPSQYCI